jgi:hypothetical protein
VGIVDELTPAEIADLRDSQPPHAARPWSIIDLPGSGQVPNGSRVQVLGGGAIMFEAWRRDGTAIVAAINNFDRALAAIEVRDAEIERLRDAARNVRAVLESVAETCREHPGSYLWSIEGDVRRAMGYLSAFEG